MKRCGFCAFSSDDAAEFEQHLVTKHAWDKVVTPDQSSDQPVSRPARWRTWWKWFGITCLFFIVLLGRSGGGFGPSTLCEPLNGLFSAGTWFALLAALILFVAAVLASALRAAELYARPASGDAPDSAVPALQQGEIAHEDSSPRGILGLLDPSLEEIARAIREARRRISPLGVAAFGLAAAVLFVPSGCAPYRLCAQADRPITAESTSDGLRFTGQLPELRQQGRRDDSNTVYTAVFDAAATWRMTWKTTADRIRLDVFASDAVQTGTFLPSIGSDGHLDVLYGGPEGSETINRTGSFCVRIDLQDDEYMEALRSYYSRLPAERTGPLPEPRRLAWTLIISP